MAKINATVATIQKIYTNATKETQKAAEEVGILKGTVKNLYAKISEKKGNTSG